MKKNITKAQFDAILFCMAQRAIQENKQKDFIEYMQELSKQDENIYKTKSAMP